MADALAEAHDWSPYPIYERVALVLMLSDANVASGLLEDMRGMLSVFPHHLIFADSPNASLGVRAVSRRSATSNPVHGAGPAAHAFGCRVGAVLRLEGLPRLVDGARAAEARARVAPCVAGVCGLGPFLLHLLGSRRVVEPAPAARLS